ncbi:MAG: hypothetical protein JSV03_17415 [Planctomycetota bacterium]|nr:MAG: hypothetical protein JSV03_17415 [Planctomycetota bacterium]
MPPKQLIHRLTSSICFITLYAIASPTILAVDTSPAKQSTDSDKTLVVSQNNIATVTEPEEDAGEISIIKALDQLTDLEVEEMPIREVVKKLSESTRVPIEIKQRALSLLPYGSRTTLSATVESQPLRDTLKALLLPIGLTFEVQKNGLVIQPTKHLARVVRRATWEELETLALLYSRPFSEELFDSLRFQFQDAPAADLETNRETLKRLCGAVGEGTVAEVLELACDQYGWAWYPLEEYISIVTKMRQVERQLDRRVSLEYEHKTLSEALLDLIKQADLLLRMDPGVMASLPPQTTQHFTLTIENATIRQALEMVAGQTGLGYFVESDGIRLTTSTFAPPTVPGPTAADATARATVAALRSNSIIGSITVANDDGSSFSFFIREDDLPPEVNEMRKSKIRKAVNDIRKTLVDEQQQD